MYELSTAATKRLRPKKFDTLGRFVYLISAHCYCEHTVIVTEHTVIVF